MRLETRWDADRIAERVIQVATALDRAPERDNLVLVSVLKGGSFFLADLARRLSKPAACEFISVRRGGNEILQIDFSTPFTVQGRPVLLLKDVVHSGVIETYLAEKLREGGASSVRVAAIIDKPQDRRTPVAVEHALFSAATGVFAGYGMEFLGLHGQRPDIVEVVEEQ
ncbi:MAG TPA: phosphoribosyltransferase family protein [Thermoanaerobaculia bacterium]